jgi:hypothetical protein
MRFLTITNVCCLLLAIFVILSSSAKCCLAAEPPAADISYDVLIRGGMVYDGSGKSPKRADVGVKGDRIAVVADLANATAKNVVDAKDQSSDPRPPSTRPGHQQSQDAPRRGCRGWPGSEPG